MRLDVVSSLGAFVALLLAGVFGVQELTRTFVVNLKDPHPIEGTVKIGEPIPHGAMRSLSEVVVAPSPRSDPALWTEAGAIDTDGFSSVVLSFQGQFRGNPGTPGTVGVVLVPEEGTVLRALSEGEIHLVLEALAEGVPDGRSYFSGTRAGLAIAFPRYRVYLYNTTDRSASVNLFAYLTN
jgi:hypothetical protein